MPTTFTTATLSSISLPTSMDSWGITYDQLSETGKKKTWAQFTICRNHPKVNMCHTSLTVDSPGKKLWREILPVDKTLISAPGCSLCLKGTGQPWFTSMANGLAGCPRTWRKVKLEMWWQDLGRSPWTELSEWAQRMRICVFQVNIRVTQQMNSLVIRWISFQFCECQPHSLFPHLPLSQIDRETVEAVADFIWGAPKSL